MGELPRVNLDDVMTRPAAHPRVENPSRSDPLVRRAFHGSASTVGAEGDGLSAHSSASSGLELTVAGFDGYTPYSDRPRSQSATALGPRSSSPGGPDVRNAILSAFHRDSEFFDARSRGEGKSDSPDMLPSGEPFPNVNTELWRRPHSPFDSRSESPTEHFKLKAATSQSSPGSFDLQAHHRSYSATNMATLVPGPPPLPPPRPSRMSTKRFSVPDILDRDGVYDPEGPSLRRMSTANITSVSSYPEQRFPSSGSSLSPFRIENHPGDRHSLSGSEGQTPPVPLPPPLPPQLQVTERSRSPSLRRITLENLTLSNSLPTIQVTDQDDAPLSPENDYPDNDLSPLTKDQPARFFPKQQQHAEVKQNIYKAVSEASTVYSAHHAASVETQSTNADSSLEDEEPREDTW